MPCSICPLISTNFLRIHSSVCVSTAGERRHKYGVFFGRKDFHGCFMVHHPLVFCLAIASHNVNLKHRGFRERERDSMDVNDSSLHACVDRRTRRLRSTVFQQALNNYRENSLISVRPVSLPVCVSRFIFAFLNSAVIYYYTS